jgi:hypothetical protein
MPYPTNQQFAESSFLIYSEFTTSNKIGGSLLIDCAATEEEASNKKAMYEKRSEEFYKDFPSLKGETQRRIIYIENKAHWWASSSSHLKIETLLE